MMTADVLHLAVQYASIHACPERSQVRRWVWAAFRSAKGQTPKPTELVVRFCDVPEARRLNRDFRGRDYATNVLTFVDPSEERISADIVLCVPVLGREARTQRKPVKNHTAHLVVHGVLHALGYEHTRASEAKAMETLETGVLALFSIPDPYQ